MIDPLAQPRAYRTFSGQNLLQVAMPMGGIGAGNICLTGYGSLENFAVRNVPATSALPDGHGDTESAFAVIRIDGDEPVTRLLEGPLPAAKVYNQGLKGQGFRQGAYEGLPRFETSTFDAAYPFGTVHLSDDTIPLDVAVTGWSPLIPRDDISSGMPCAFLEYRFTNNTDESVNFEFSYHLTHLPGFIGGWKESRNSRLKSAYGTTGGGINFETTLPSDQEKFGSSALYALGWQPEVKTMWLRGGWFDGISALWREVSTGSFKPNEGAQPVEEDEGRNGGSLLIKSSLAPGESVTYPIAIAWHFPNSSVTVGLDQAAACAPGSDCDCGPAWRMFYAKVWPDAAAVVLHAAREYGNLRSRTLAFQQALTSSTASPEIIDAVSSNLAILKSTTILRQENGNVWAWEGCFTSSGCCHGSCTHVWNYAQAMPHLFPALERTLREQELQRSMDEHGHVNFRSALPDGPTSHDFHAAADGQLGGILKLYRDYLICGGKTWLAGLYPAAKLSLDYGIRTWDPDERGGLFEPHHNTYDIEFWGPDGMCGSIYVAALSALGAMARLVGAPEDAPRYEALALKAAQFTDEQLFNGEYYQQNIQWDGEVHTASFRDMIASVNEDSSELLQLQKAEGPRYQYGSGCLSDGIIGAWMADIYGIETPLNREHIRATLQAIYTHNFKPDLFRHANTQRPGYAIGHEPGLILCTWPRGGKPTLPFVYSDEVWTGIEYQVASHLINEGFVDEGHTLVAAVRSRYDGYVRNPFNEYECGSYYARAMASFALLNTLSGFRYSAPDKVLSFGPKTKPDSDAPFVSFFSTDAAFGTVSLGEGQITVTVIEGTLPIERLRLTVEGQTVELPWSVTVLPGTPAVRAIAG